MTEPLRGLSWDHPRGYWALEEVARSAGAPTVLWERQPLEGFEDGPDEEQASNYDLIVVDHPAIGAPAAAGWLLPMEELFSNAELAAWASKTVGRSFESYKFDSHQWALPVDAAVQVGAWHARVFHEGENPTAGTPKTWADVAEVGHEIPMVLCLGGPHALLMLAAIALSAGGSLMAEPDRFISRDAGEAAFEMMQQLSSLSEPSISLGNPIAVLEAVASGAAVYCPLVYGYVTYQSAGRDQLRAVDAPSWGLGGRRGSVLGGAGVAVSSRCGRLAAATCELRRLMAPSVQVGTYAAFGGQASLVAAWEDPNVDQQTNGFYRATRATIDEAWVRPRWPGYTSFQRHGSEVVREGLRSGAKASSVLAALDDVWSRANAYSQENAESQASVRA